MGHIEGDEAKVFEAADTADTAPFAVWQSLVNQFVSLVNHIDHHTDT
jgi:hypothetical protein